MIDKQSSASEHDYASDRSAIGAGDSFTVLLIISLLNAADDLFELPLDAKVKNKIKLF